MAASGFTPISLYYSTTASAVPTSGNLANGELGLNIADMKLYAKNSAGTVTLLASNAGASGSVTSVSGTGTVNGLTLTGTVTTSGSLTLGGTLSLVSPPPIGSTTPNTGAFTTLSATGTTSINGAILALNSVGSSIQHPSGGSLNIASVAFGGNANIVVNAASGFSVYQQVAGATITLASSTGLAVTGTLSATGAVTITSGGTAINLNGATSNYIGWGTDGVATPTFTARSAGTKLVLYPSLSPTAADYGFGIASGILWSSIPTTSADFRWYGGTTIAATLSGTGNLSVAGTLTSTSTASFSNANFTIDANGSFTTQGSTIGTNVPNGTVGINTGPAGGVGLTLTNKAGNTAHNTLRVVGIASQTSIVDVVNSASTSLFNVLGNGAIGVNGSSYGTAGQVLTSGGSGAAPTWATAGGGGQVFAAFGGIESVFASQGF